MSYNNAGPKALFSDEITALRDRHRDSILYIDIEKRNVVLMKPKGHIGNFHRTFRTLIVLMNIVAMYDPYYNAFAIQKNRFSSEAMSNHVIDMFDDWGFPINPIRAGKANGIVSFYRLADPRAEFLFSLSRGKGIDKYK